MRLPLLTCFIFICSLLQAQIMERTTTPQDLPNLVPGYSQITNINIQNLSFTYTPNAPDPTPVEGDTTTESNGKFKFGEMIPVSLSLGHGNYTQTSLGKVWTLAKD